LGYTVHIAEATRGQADGVAAVDLLPWDVIRKSLEAPMGAGDAGPKTRPIVIRS
jgi:hypothetical protein